MGMMVAYRAITLIGLLLLVACGQPGSRTAVLPSGASTFQLPKPSSLKAATSAQLHYNGAECIAQRGGEVIWDKLVLRTGAGMGAGPAGELAWAAYAFGPLTTVPRALRVTSGTNYAARVWVAVANHARNRWDYVPGEFKGGPTFYLDELGDPTPYLSAEGQLLVAVLLMGADAPWELRTIEVPQPAEAEDVTASQDRWEGVRLNWSEQAQAQAYRIFRREGADWLEVTPAPLGKYAVEFTDYDAPSGTSEYRLVVGRQYMIRSIPEWFWSPGVTVTGQRPQSTLPLDSAGIEAYWPANLHNRLSFFFTTTAVPEEPAVAWSSTFPPGHGWSMHPSGEDGFGQFHLGAAGSVEPPFTVNQYDEINNPAISLAYSGPDGCYCQVGLLNSEGEVEWEAPVQLRSEPSLHLLGLVDVPRHLIAFMWNDATEQIEAMQTVDELGRIWTPFDAMSWMTVSGRRPGGPVDLNTVEGAVLVCFAEAETDAAVVLRNAPGEGWTDISPTLTVRGTPRMRMIQKGLGPGSGLVYLRGDGSAIELLRRENDAWAASPVELYAGASEITEWDLRMNGAPSNDNYLVFITNGELWFRHTYNPDFSAWLPALPVDQDTSCRLPRTTVVGTDETFTQRMVFACYVKDAPSGLPELNYRDLKAIVDEFRGN
jgi:hypothetical protein